MSSLKFIYPICAKFSIRTELYVNVNTSFCIVCTPKMHMQYSLLFSHIDLARALTFVFVAMQLLS